MHYPRHDISCVILAGGRGSRMNSADKGLLLFNKRPLIEHVIAAVSPQVSAIIISANRNLETYRKFHHPVVLDSLPNYQGPLAGIYTALNTITTDFLLTVPCDSPQIISTLGRRLYQEFTHADVDLVVAYDGRRCQPVFSMMKRRVASSLDEFLSRGHRKIDRWYETIQVRQADCQDLQQCFVNLNTPEDLKLKQAK